MNTGSEELNQFLESYKEKTLTTIYGEAGTGKSTLCLLAAIEYASNNKKVLFIDTEQNFSLERFEQLLNNKNKDCLKNIMILKVNSFNVQHSNIKALEELKNISLIIVDSITNYYRRLSRREPELATGMLAKQLMILRNIAINNDIPIIVTSQVYSNMEKEIIPLGREKLTNFSKKVIKLEKNPRKIIDETQNKEANLEIMNEGIRLI
jgi:DNA repair protein RadB